MDNDNPTIGLHDRRRLRCCRCRRVERSARAQSDYPNKPVRIIVDSAAGSANDATARILGDKLSKIWNQQVLTLNQPGAGGGISAKVASQSPNDGYTLYMPATSPFLALPGASGRRAEPAARTAARLRRRSASCCSSRCYIGASHKSGINSIADVIRMAKEKPGEVTYAATGRGRLTHLTMELLQARTGIKLQLVPYAGGPAQAMNDVMSGRVPLVLDAYAGLAARDQGRPDQGARRHRAGAAARLREPADHRRDGARTSSSAPGPCCWRRSARRTPIIRKVNADLRTALDDPDVKTKLDANGGVRAPHDAGGGHGVRAGASRRPGGRSWSRWRRRRSSDRGAAPSDHALHKRRRVSRGTSANSRAFASSAACSIVMNTAPSAASFVDQILQRQHAVAAADHVGVHGVGQHAPVDRLLHVGELVVPALHHRRAPAAGPARPSAACG